MRVKPEVLCPAGDIDALRAAVRAGADAVYFGLQDYNARIRARNFDRESLPEIVAELHRDGVKAYVTFNTLLFASEEEAGRATLDAIAEAGPDALIVQDLGVARWVHERRPELAIHASTQMTISSREGIEFLERFGVKRVILARELTIPEIARIRGASDVELEVFVHGALCVSYSGQCLSSEAWGGRSANRGQCAQACRLPYELIVDGRKRELGEQAFLLSPKDLEGYRRIPELVALGIDGFKIEGRMKSAEYVAAATALYRDAVDRAWDARGDEAGALERLADRSRRIFSRGASEGFLGGIDHQRLVDGRIRSHRGVRLGRLVAFGRSFAEIDLEKDAPEPTPGDGILFAAGPLEEQETGAKVFAVEPVRLRVGRRIRARFGEGRGPDPDRLAIDGDVYLTHDHVAQADLHRWIVDPERRKRIHLRIEVGGAEGAPLSAVFTDPEGRAVRVESTMALVPAERHALDREAVESHLGRLGGSRYSVRALELRLEGALALPVSEMNRMRREAVEALEQMRAAGGGSEGWLPPGGAPVSPFLAAAENPPLEPGATPAGAVHASPVADAVERAEGAVSGVVDAGGPVAAMADPFVVLCRTIAQVEGALGAGARRVALDFLDLVGLKSACALAREAGVELSLALPRIQKPGEERIWDFFLARRPDEILVRNLASLRRLGCEPERPRLVGDVSLNAVNPSAVEILLQSGCDRVSPGLDLNGEQLDDLLARVDASRIEVPLHHYLPVFHTEHCVFAAFMSDGADWRSCGRPCDRHRVHLRDRTGQEHALIADVGCRNTVFGARAQSVLDRLGGMREHGVRSYRLELLEQDARATAELLATYRAVWDGAAPASEGLRRLQAEARFGIFSGSPEPERKPDWKPQGGKRREAGTWRRRR